MSISQQRLLKIGEAARILGVSVDTIRRLARRGELPEYRDSHQVRYYCPEHIEVLRQKRIPRLVAEEVAQ
jgi:excisionase family DNA binding protein